jgi:hypothetical protein
MAKTIDLHGFTVKDALDEVVYQYNAELIWGSKNNLYVIHGYGSTGVGGIIRRTLRMYLASRNVTFKCGDDNNNRGVTIVYIGQHLLTRDPCLPRVEGSMPNKPWQEPGSLSKLETEYHREVNQNRHLEKQLADLQEQITQIERLCEENEQLRQELMQKRAVEAALERLREESKQLRRELIQKQAVEAALERLREENKALRSHLEHQEHQAKRTPWWCFWR